MTRSHQKASAASKTASYLEHVVVATFGIGTLIFLVAPMIVVALASLDPGEFFTFPPTSISGRWYREFVSSEPWQSSLFLSLTIALISALAATVVGTLAGIGVTRLPPGLRRIAYGLLAAPLAVPVIVLAISYYRVVLELQLVGNLSTFVFANMLLTSPLVALFVVGAFLNIDPALERASLSCGAGPWRTLARVTIPSIAPAATAGFVVSILYSLDEVVMSIFLVAPGRTPLAVRMFLEVQQGTVPVVTAVATILTVVTIVGLGILVVARNLRAGAAGALFGSPREAIASPLRDAS